MRLWVAAALVWGVPGALAQEPPDLEDIPIEAGEPEPEQPSPVDDREPDEWFGDFEIELRLFPRDALRAGQPDHASTALAYRPGYVIEPRSWLRLRAIALVRVDEHDPERSTIDVREAISQLSLGRWTITLGVHKVFWGVTESRHLVDLVNSVDYAEDLDGEERLGQPMAMVSYESGRVGLIDAFVTTWHRQPRFPGVTGRPGLPLPIASDEAIYESSLDEWRPDLALRWSRSLGELEWALSYFYGTAREPQLLPAVIDGEMVFQPVYDLVHQGGLELQWTRGPWLSKLEAIARSGQGPGFVAVTGGFERKISQVVGDADLTLFIEYNHDGRDNQTFNLYESHAFAAARLSLNDPAGTEATLGALVDVTGGDALGLLEASRRLGGGWKAVLEARVFAAEDTGDVLFFFRRDHYLEASLQYHY